MRSCLLWWIVAGNSPKRGNKMNLLRKLSWFFNIEKKRYLIGIGSLILVSFLNLIPPRIMGLVIDLIDKRRLTLRQLVVDIALLVLAALAMYGLRFVWRRYIFGTANKLARILRYRLFKQFTLMTPSFYQRYRTGDLMAHATNDINAVTMFAGGGVMALNPLGYFAPTGYGGSDFRHWPQKPQSLQRGPRRLLRAEQLCSGISIRSQGDQILWLSGR